MSFLRKSDVKNHLSPRSGISTHPPDPTRRDPATSPENNAAGTRPEQTDIGIRLDPISPPAVPAAQAGGSTGTVEKAQDFGKRS